jgi:hypothetical protein
VTKSRSTSPPARVRLPGGPSKSWNCNGVKSTSAFDVSGSAANSSTTGLNTGLAGAVAGVGELVVGAVSTTGTTALTLAQGSSSPTAGWVALTDFGTGTTSWDVVGRAAYFNSTAAGAQYKVAWASSAAKSGGGAAVVVKAGP